MRMKLEGMNICVVGLGRTGRAVVRFAARRGARVFVSDLKKHDEVELGDVRGLVAEAEFGRNSYEFMRRADVVVISPGVPADLPVIRKLEGNGRKIMSELEFASMFIDAPVVAITGSVGKSTTVALVGEMARAAGLKVFVGGNFGPPAIEAADEALDLCVLEVSSFQLEATYSFRPHVAGWLNLVGHHLERHGGFENYANTKLRMFLNQTNDDIAILNGDETEIIARTASIRSQKFLFSMLAHPAPGIFLDGDSIVRVAGSGREEYSLEGFGLRGRHNIQNLLCAIGCARAAGIAREAVIAGYTGFRGLEHRLEDCGVFSGVRYVNDSKATTPFAVRAAVEAVGAPVILLLGGRDEGEDFSCVLDAARGKVKAVVAFGEAAGRIAELFRGEFEVIEAGDVASAVDAARKLAAPGDTVLFSPGCPSFDEFANFEERGRKFKELVSDEAA